MLSLIINCKWLVGILEESSKGSLGCMWLVLWTGSSFNPFLMPCSFSLMISLISSLFLTPHPTHKNCSQARGCTFKLDTQSAHFWPPTQLLSRAKSQSFEFFQAPGLLLASIFALWSYPPQSQSCAAVALISTDGIRVPQTEWCKVPWPGFWVTFWHHLLPPSFPFQAHWPAFSTEKHVPASGTPPGMRLPCWGPFFPCFLPEAALNFILRTFLFIESPPPFMVVLSLLLPSLHNAHHPLV